MPRGRREGLARRLGWFAGLWIASVAAVAAVAYSLRWWLVP